MKLFDREPLFAELRHRNLSEWAESLRIVCAERLTSEYHGTMPQWIDAWNKLPRVNDATVDAFSSVISISGNLESDHDSLRRTLMSFHPWRKGPFNLFGLEIDTEWRSDLKWDRLRGAVQLDGKTVLDVGCGNGYFGWRMLAEGAEFVVGCDPFLLYVMQFEVIRRYAPNRDSHFVVPIGDTELPPGLHAFDVAFSMGVLYHRTSPIDHLQTMWHSLRANGQLVLETLVIESDEPHVLVPEGRYAKMRNVWFIPSVSMLERWLQRTGFRDVETIDVTVTTTDEQRRTDWMTYESLSDFLDNENSSLTVEGHPTPVRALLTATRV